MRVPSASGSAPAPHARFGWLLSAGPGVGVKQVSESGLVPWSRYALVALLIVTGVVNQELTWIGVFCITRSWDADVDADADGANPIP